MFLLSIKKFVGPHAITAKTPNGSMSRYYCKSMTGMAPFSYISRYVAPVLNKIRFS